MTETYDKLNHWYGWNGGECPVHPKTVVQTSGAWGLGCKLPARRIGWGNDQMAAFRIINLHVEPREFWIVGTLAYQSERSAIAEFPGATAIHVREVEQPL